MRGAHVACIVEARPEQPMKVSTTVEAGHNLSTFVVVTDVSVWQAMRVRAVSPGATSMACASDMSAHGIVLLGEAPPARLLQHAAQSGFPTMTGLFLSKLAKHLSIPPSGTIRQVLGRLLSHVCPDMPDEQHAAILDRRCSSECPLDAEDAAHSKLLDPNVRELVAHLIDKDDDELEIKALVENHETRKAARPALAKKRPPPVPSAAEPALAPNEDAPEQPASAVAPPPASSAAAPGPAPQRLPRAAHEGTPAEAKPYLPKVAGCRIFRDTAIYTRWLVLYPTQRPPRSCSKGWLSTGLTERQAFLHVLRWCWAQHTEATCQQCPFDLPE